MTNFQHGFSFVQILVALSLVVVFFTDLPKKLDIVSSTNVKYEADKFANTLWFAKTEAANRGVNITVCTSPDTQQCSPQSNWSDGWMVFIDESNNASFDPMSDHVLRTRLGRDIDLTMVGSGSAKDHVSFTSDGKLVSTSGQSPVGIVSVCAANKLDRNSRAIRLDTSGDISIVNALELKGASCKA